MRRNAFSIVELLVVIGAIALLIGLLAPALSSVGAGGRSTRCQSNLRQMANAANNYAAMYDAYPAALRFENINGTFQRVAWDWVTTFSDEVISPGALWTFTDNPGEVQQCPEFEGASTYDGDPYTGYNYNTTYIGAEAPFPSTGWANVRKGVPPHACGRCAQCAMFGEGGWKGGANKFMRAPLNSENLGFDVIYGGGQAFRHRRSTNLAYVDGHVGSANKIFQGKHATPNLLGDTMAYPANGFLSDDDSAYSPR
jgi:prepilin-type processing-associated H-X9-DG protein